jgi:hypothetical protein
MRFRLRTLLILMAVAGLLFTRIGYLKRMADFHRREVARIGGSISVAEREDEGQVAASIKELAEGDTELVVGTMTDSLWMGRVGVYDKDMTGRLVKDAATAESWREAAVHQVIANRYDRACYRPWMTVSESTGRPTGRRVAWLIQTWTLPSDIPPPLATPPFFQLTVREPILLATVVVLTVSWWIVRSRGRKTAGQQHESKAIGQINHVPTAAP